MLSTHDVSNQSTPFTDVNLFTSNRPLQDALAHHHPGFHWARFEALGALCGSAEMQVHARLANTQGPRLLTHDRFGSRIDQVEFHPAYHALLEAACGARLHGSPWAEGPGGHIERAAAFMLFTELEPSVLCPVSMTYAVAPSLRAHPALHAAFGPGLTAPRYDARFMPHAAKLGLTMGMGMTEKQGGSDVRANTTRAEFDGEDAWGRRYRLTGHKWFFSAPMCDAFLVLAQAQTGTEGLGTGASAGGLSCFFLPRWRPDGTVNPLHIQRLKHKLGNHANASSEVEFEGTHAWLVGEVGRGVPQILAMGALTRLDCALGTAGLMRQALSLALHHTAQRHAFGKALIEQPLMKAVLADLALESSVTPLHRPRPRSRDAPPAHPCGQVLDLQARQRLCPGSYGVPGRQRLRGRAGRGRDGAYLSRDAPEFHLGGRRQHHGAGPDARLARTRRGCRPGERMCACTRRQPILRPRS
jgi:putative acyl-CoA dehydrogenase